MLDEDEFDRWRAAAGETLAATRDNAERGWHNWACVMAEQAAQLAVKGLLHAWAPGGWPADTTSWACWPPPPSATPYTSADAERAQEEADTVVAAVDAAHADLARAVTDDEP